MKDQLLLTAALEGLQLQKQRIEEQIAEVKALLGRHVVRRGRPLGSTNKSRAGRLSPAARKRIGAAQKRRWAEFRKSNGSSNGA